MALAAIIFGPTMSRAQHGGGGPAPKAATPAPEVSQFEFLVGQWELVVRPKVSSLAARIHGAPRLVGTWKAWRSFDGFGLEDEIRIVDGSGNPMSLSRGFRIYDPATARWNLTSLDVYRARFGSATAEWKNGEMVSTGSGMDQEGKPVMNRTRFYQITPTSFRMQQDRSSDGGRTWTEGLLTIEAKRVAATATR
jgi:hypothetical protein